MNRALFPLMCAAALLGGCHDAIYPSLCLFTSDELGSSRPEEVDASKCPDGFKVTDGQGFYVLHELPPDVTASEPLHLKIATPCTTIEIDQSHTAPTKDAPARVLVPVVAPPGARCSLVVTASIENHSAEANSNGDDCADVKAACDAAAGQGGGGGSP